MPSRVLLTCCAVRVAEPRRGGKVFLSSFVRPAGYAHVAGRAGERACPPLHLPAQLAAPLFGPQAEGLMGSTLNRFYHRFAESVQ